MRSTGDDAASDTQEVKRLSDVREIKARYMPAEKEEQTEILSVYHDNMMKQMNADDYDDFRAKTNAAHKKL
jgi:hypothetical protein